MLSCVCTGSLFHQRLSPVAHRFTYPVYFYGLRLSELPDLHRRVRGFSHNGRNVVSLRDADYLRAGPGTLVEKLAEHTRADGIVADPARTLLFTSARFFNYVFNPVSFYFGLNDDDTPAWALAEVNNTFQDRHVYWLPRLEFDGTGWTARRPKDFHVSPFNDLEGEYAFRFQLRPDRVVFEVDLFKQGQPFLRTSLSGRPQPFTTGALWRTLARFPLGAALTFPRIVAQAAVLKFRHRIGWHPRPAPASSNTIRRREDA